MNRQLIQKKTRQKSKLEFNDIINQVDLKDINQVDLTDIYGTFHLNTK